jgi:hypothetical protein
MTMRHPSSVRWFSVGLPGKRAAYGTRSKGRRLPSLAAEVEVKLNGITEGPSTIACLKTHHGLSLGERDVQVIGPGRYRQALNFFHRVA